MKKTILSGITPSGNLTIGNYIGAIDQWRELQKSHECFYMIADLHAFTVKQDPHEFKTRTLHFLAQYLACGLDPSRNVIFLQSHVPQHTQLAWILSCLTPLGQLNRMAQYKDKSKTQTVNTGLYTYPILMASDILLYQTDLVPVGEDQRQHLELTRDIVQYVHNRYESIFKMPSPHIPPQGAKIMSLQDPTKKMSKSDSNPKASLFVMDEPKKIQKKIAAAVTDSGSSITVNKSQPGISNLLVIHSSLSKSSLSSLEKEFLGKSYGEFKKKLSETICDHLSPVQKKYTDLLKNPDYLTEVLKKGTDKARERAESTLHLVHEKTGFLLF